MKKIISVLIASAMLLTALCSCSNNNSAESQTVESQTESVISTVESEVTSEDESVSSEPEEVEEGVLNSSNQKAINTFLSNFAEQRFEYFDFENPDYAALLNFSYMFCKINQKGSGIELVSDDVNYYYTYSLDSANKVINKYFNLTIDDEQAQDALYGDGSHYCDGLYYVPAADGEQFNLFAVADTAELIGDDIYNLTFTIYQTDGESVSKSCYALTSDEAKKDSSVTKVGEGTAYIKQIKGKYVLMRYDAR